MPKTQDDDKLSIQTQAVMALGCAVVYFYAFKLNQYWFEQLEFSPGVNWVFIPSGLRLLLVLVLLRTGAIGITLGSIAVNYSFDFAPESHVFNIVTGLISGTSPCLARYVAKNWFKLKTELTNLDAQLLLKISILFAATNALLHQLWFFWIGQIHDFISSTLVMGVGDWFGTVLVLTTASLVIKLYKLSQASKF